MHKSRLSFIEKVDTVLQFPEISVEQKRIDSIFKLSSLFSESIIMSDTQVIDNKGLRCLFFEDVNFQKYFSQYVKIGMRSKASSFIEVFDQQISEGAKHSSLPEKVQKAIEKGEIKNVHQLQYRYPELRIGPFLQKLDEMYDKGNIINVKFNNYEKMVEESLGSFIKTLEQSDSSNEKYEENLIKLCNELMYRATKEVEKKKYHTKLTKSDGIDRSSFYLAIENSPYDNFVKETIKREVVDSEYNKNFWENNGFDCIKHNFPKHISNILAKTELESEGQLENKDTNIIEKVSVPGLDPKKLNFELIFKLHQEHDDVMKLSLHNIKKCDDPELGIDIFTDYLQFLSKKFSDTKYNSRVNNLEFPVVFVSGALPFFCTIPPEISLTTTIGSYVITKWLKSDPVKNIINKQNVTFNKNK